MLKRVLSGVVGGAIFIALGVLNGIWLTLGLGGLLLLGIYEFWRMNRGAAQRMHLEIPAVVEIGRASCRERV